MYRISFLKLIVLFAALMGTCAQALACGGADECAVKNGFYRAAFPSGWDGKKPLPVVMYFHGFGGSANYVMSDATLVKAVGGLGALLIVPNGEDRSWSFPGKMTGSRDDFAFVQSVLDDVERRFPVDKTRVLATGFSLGGSMTWYLACLMPQRFTAFAPVAGAFWNPLPQNCPGGPVFLRHIHGTDDGTVPMQGRALRGGLYKQGDVLQAFETLKARDGCAVNPPALPGSGAQTCQDWPRNTCKRGGALSLCLHPGGHVIDPAWVVEGYRWMERVALPARERRRTN